MDVTNLILYLKSKITDQTIDQQMVSKAIRLLELGAVFTADSFAALPAAVGRSGQLWYVLYDGLYWSNGVYWVPIAQTFFSELWSWGNNTYGRLGDNTQTTRSSPVSVVGGFANWCQVDAGGQHTVAVRSSGSAWAWGRNNYGQLGNNDTVNSTSPVSVVGGFTDWCRASGGFHTVALRATRTAWAWGLNNSGQLGDNTSTRRSSPVGVVGGFTDWCQINADENHTTALRSSGTAWAWGFNGSGPLGDNTTTTRSSPVSVVGGFTDWCQISAGNDHTVALRTSGTAWAWGGNSSGQLGAGNYTSRSSPVSVVGGFTNWCQISAGSSHTVALRSTGSAWTWGRGTEGQLGNNNASVNAASPISVVGGFTNWCQVSAGGFSTLAIQLTGSAWGWGRNNYGQIGDGCTSNRSSPVSVIGGFTNWCQIAAGQRCFSAGIRNST